MSIHGSLAQEPLVFEQYVLAEGYELVEGQQLEEHTLYVVEAAPINAQKVPHRYQPLKRLNLHRQFGRTCQDPEGVRAFAEKFGLLNIAGYDPDPFWGDGIWHVDVAGWPSEQQQCEHPEWGLQPVLMVESYHVDNVGREWPERDYEPRLIAEPIAFWLHEMHNMAFLIKLWDLVREEKVAQLGEYFHWQATPHIALFHPPITPVYSKDPDAVQDCIERPEILDQWQFGDVIEPARAFVYQIIANKLQDRIKLMLSPLRKGEVVVTPKNLLAALYILFAQEVSGQSRQPKTCKGCTRFFIPAHGNQFYCEPACSDRHWWHESKSPKSPKMRKGKKAR